MAKKQDLEQRKKEYIDDLRPIDDLFMRCMFSDNLPLVQYVLQILLGNKNLRLVSSETQKDVVGLGGAHSATLDLVAKDSQRKMYNVEVQRKKSKDLYNRILYYAGIMNRESLKAGQPYRTMLEYWIIFIMEHDIFRDGDPIHYIKHMDLKTNTIIPDAEHILLANGEYRGNNDFGRLMHDFHCSKASEMFLRPMAVTEFIG